MNIQEAIRSGKKFRRKSSSNRDYYSHLVLRMELPIGDILADDWEIQSSQVITTEQFFHAYTEALKETEAKDSYALGEVINCLAKRLGL